MSCIQTTERGDIDSSSWGHSRFPSRPSKRQFAVSSHPHRVLLFKSLQGEALERTMICDSNSGSPSFPSLPEPNELALKQRQTQLDEVSGHEVKLRLTPVHIRAVSTPMVVHLAFETGSRAPARSGAARDHARFSDGDRGRLKYLRKSCSSVQQERQRAASSRSLIPAASDERIQTLGSVCSRAGSRFGVVCVDCAVRCLEPFPSASFWRREGRLVS